MKKTKYQEFDVGRAGKGRIDFSDGSLVFAHEDTKSNSAILPIEIAHVYSSDVATEAQASTTYGRGFKLNLEQRLTNQKQSHGEGDDSKWKLTDASGKEHKFKERFYYKNGDEKIYIQPSQVKIDLDGKMTFGEREVFKIVRTKSGLKLETELNKTIQGSELLETRHEDIVKLENEIKQLKMQSKQIEYEYKSLGSELRSNIFNDLVIEKQINGQNLTIKELQDEIHKTTQDYNDLIRKKNGTSMRIVPGKDNGWNIFNPSLMNPDTISIAELCADAIDYYGKEVENCFVHEKVEFEKLDYLSVYQYFKSPVINGYTPKGSDEDDGGKEETQYAYLLFSKIFEEACERLTQDIREWNFEIEKQSKDYREKHHFDELKTQMLDLQKDIIAIRAEKENASGKFEVESDSDVFESLQKLAEIELKVVDNKLKNSEHSLKKMTELMPVNFVVGDDNQIFGFNKDGNLVVISDSFENQVAIVYEDGLIKSVVDSNEKEMAFEYDNNKRLTKIIDFQERKTKFEYEGDLLVKVIYPNKEETKFSYFDSKLSEILNPAKLGVRLEYNANRITKITEISMLKSLDNDGIVEADEEEQNTVVQIAYSDGKTVVSASKDNSVAQYVFDNEKELVAEHISESGKLKSLSLYDIKSESYAFTQQYSEFEEGFDVQSIIASFLAQNNNRTYENVKDTSGDWTFVEINQDRKTTAEFSHTEKTGEFAETTQKTFVYDDKDNLIEETQIIKKTGKKDRVLKTEYQYNKKNMPVRSIDSHGIVKEIIYDKKGNAVKNQTYHISNPSAKFVEEKEVSENGQVLSEIDERGNKTTLKYIDGTNTVSGSTDPSGVETAIGYDPHTKEVTSIATSVNGEANSSQHKYVAGFLTELATGGMKFNYGYDHFGRKSSIDKNGENYVRYEFEEDSGNDTSRSIYANGEGYETISDKSGKVLEVYYLKGNGKAMFVKNEYDSKDRLTKSENKISKETTLYEYNEKGDVVCERGRVIVENETDTENNSKSVSFTVGDRQHNYEYQYDDEDKLQYVVLPNGDMESCEYDVFDRVTKYESAIGTKEVSYLQSGERATNLVSSVTQKLSNGEFSKQRFTYDKSGNITQIHEAGQLVVRYEYDALSRLVREDNKKLGRTYTYEYDSNGNILFKWKFDFTLESNLPNGELIEYQYNGDEMISFNDQVCTYDVLGNPTVYRGKDLKWSHVRNLDSIGDIKLRYNGNERICKKVDNLHTEYYTDNNQLVAEKRSLKTQDLQVGDFLFPGYAYTEEKMFITYLYGVDGISGFKVEQNGIEAVYHYRKNIMGDVTHIYNPSGECVARYVYDAWGNHIVENFSDENIGDINPIRYRGYYFDVETGLYYLKSRYYDSETGRFINADMISILDESKDLINGLNLFAYCGNNPVMRTDESGAAWWKSKWFGWIVNAVIAIVSVAAIVVATVATGGLLSAVLLGAGIGALTGMGGSIIAQGGFASADPWQVAKAGGIGATIGAITGAASWGLGTIAQAYGQQLGFAIGNMTHLSSGIKIGKVISTALLMKIGSIVGNVVGGIIGATIANYFANDWFGNHKSDFNKNLSDSVLGEIPSWLVNIFKWLRK